MPCALSTRQAASENRRSAQASDVAEKPRISRCWADSRAASSPIDGYSADEALDAVPRIPGSQPEPQRQPCRHPGIDSGPLRHKPRPHPHLCRLRRFSILRMSVPSVSLEPDTHNRQLSTVVCRVMCKKEVVMVCFIKSATPSEAHDDDQPHPLDRQAGSGLRCVNASPVPRTEGGTQKLRCRPSDVAVPRRDD